MMTWTYVNTVLDFGPKDNCKHGQSVRVSSLLRQRETHQPTRAYFKKSIPCLFPWSFWFEPSAHTHCGTFLVLLQLLALSFAQFFVFHVIKLGTFVAFCQEHLARKNLHLSHVASYSSFFLAAFSSFCILKLFLSSFLFNKISWSTILITFVVFGLSVQLLHGDLKEAQRRGPVWLCCRTWLCTSLKCGRSLRP